MMLLIPVLKQSHLAINRKKTIKILIGNDDLETDNIQRTIETFETIL